MKYSRPRSRVFVSTFMICALIMVSVGMLAFASTAGRDYSRCIKTCNATRAACGDNCQTDCRVLYSNEKAFRDACISACKSTCNAESDECKQVCQSIKNPPTEELP